MATFNKFQQFPEDLASKVHDLIGSGAGIDALKIYLSNSTPDAALDAVKADLAEITPGNGYTGPVSITPVGSRAAGTVSLSGTKVTITANGGPIGPFRYVVLVNDTPTSPADPLIGWWDYGSEITLADGESFEVKFSNSDTTGLVLEIA